MASTRPARGQDNAELMLGVYEKVMAASFRPFQIVKKNCAKERELNNLCIFIRRLHRFFSLICENLRNLRIVFA